MAPALETEELSKSGDFTKALFNILEDFSVERARSTELQKALMNILEDMGSETHRLESTQRAVLNILEDAGEEKYELQSTQRAVLNILEDFELEKNKVETFNKNLQREISERQQVESELLEKGQALSRSNSDLEQFAYVASHDLQEPLRMVSSYVQLFARRYKDMVDPEAAKYISYAVDGAKRMQVLISGLLEYSRIGRDELHSRVDTSSALGLAIINNQTVLNEAGATVSFGEMPEVLCDLTQLTQVFQNLISNAIKFARAETPAKIRVECRKLHNEWLFSVADNGIGIEAAHSDRIFIIFQRLHTRAAYPGMGLGLSICRKVIERHNGRIWVESEIGQGSTFYFTLPAV